MEGITGVRKLSLLFFAMMVACELYAGEVERISSFGISTASFQTSVQEHVLLIQHCRDTGSAWVRGKIAWDEVEAQKGSLAVPSNVLQNVENTAHAGLKTVVVLGCRNHLYEGGEFPASEAAVDAFARYVEFVTKTFKDSVEYWEVSDEPESPDAAVSGSDPKGYVSLLRSAYRSCKKENPKCKVIGVCGSPADLAFGEAILKAGAGKFMDVLSVHIRPPASASDISNLRKQIIGLRSLMDKEGMKGKPIWVSEMGFSRDASEIPSNTQASLMVRTYIEMLSCGVEVVFCRNWGDGKEKTNAVKISALTREDDSTKALRAVYKTMTEAIGGAKYDRSVWLGENIRAYVFKKDKTEVTAMWCNEGVSTVTFVGEDKIRIIGGVGGRDITLTPVNGTAALTLTELPCCVIRETEMHPLNVLPVGAYQFFPPQATITPGETMSVGLQVVNGGRDAVNLKVRFLSEQVQPAEQMVRLEPESKSLLTAKASIPTSCQDTFLIPAEVWSEDKLVAQLAMLVRVVPVGTNNSVRW